MAIGLIIFMSSCPSVDVFMKHDSAPSLLGASILMSRPAERFLYPKLADHGSCRTTDPAPFRSTEHTTDNDQIQRLKPRISSTPEIFHL